MTKKLKTLGLLLVIGSLFSCFENCFCATYSVKQDGTGDFYTIQSAVNGSGGVLGARDTIIVYPGTYLESVNVGGARHLNITGVDKNSCIIKTTSGLYADAPLEISGDCTVSNLTIIATHDDYPVLGNDYGKSYAIHADYGGSGTFEVNNCILTSYQMAAFGSGSTTNAVLRIVNSDVRTYAPHNSLWSNYGAVFFHNSQISGVLGQKLEIENSSVISLNSFSIYIYDANKEVGDGFGNDCSIFSEKSYYYSYENGVSGLVRTTNKTTGNLSGCINLLNSSYGNNINELNYLNSTIRNATLKNCTID